MHRLRARLERLEGQNRGKQEYALVPVPHDPDRTMRLPRRWVEFLIEKAREDTAGGQHHHRTDGQ